MSKRKSCRLFLPALALLSGVFAVAGCDRQGTDAAATATTGTSGPASRPAHPIVSLSPAGTDLLLAMNAGDALVGVSTYDADPRVAALPRVGDYLTVDWERMATLRPEHLIVQAAADRMPAGFVDRAASMHIAVHRIQIDRLDDISAMAEAIGDAIGRHDAGEALSRSMREALDAVRARVAGRSRVRTLVALSEDGLTVAGSDNYLDDLLTAAGGENVLGPERHGYLKIDRELLLSLNPDAVIQLAPAATAAEQATNAQAWASMPNLAAVQNHRVLIVTDPWSMMPGAHVVDLARRFADHLHPETR